MVVNILNLPLYSVVRIHHTDHDYHIYAETVHPLAVCPSCQASESVGYGRNEVLVKDLPIHAKRVGIYINARRFKCRKCSKTFMEKLPEIDERRLMTVRLIDYIGKQSLSRTFTSIADDVGVTEGTIRGIFRDYVNRLEATVRFETPQWMGIDEIHIIKRPRCVISNIRHNTIVNILHDRNKRTLTRYLYQLKNRDDVKYAAMDMWNPYRDAVKGVLPDAAIVVDKFHVVRMANEAMEAIRKSLRASLQPNQRRKLMHDRFVLLKRQRDLSLKESFLLQTWLGIHSELEAPYRLKEDFYDIWDSSAHKNEALSRYKVWATQARQYAAFQPLITAVSNWETEIFAYFDHRITNAFTESLNNLIKVMNRLGRGYSFEALRAKILFTRSVHKVKRPAFTRASEGDMLYSLKMPSSTPGQGGTINYGTDISTLIELIEEDRF
jgi:transposase